MRRRASRATTPTATNADYAGQAYQPHIEEQLQEQRKRKESLESRAFTVITSAGAITTLLFGLSALVSQSKGFDLPTLSRWLLASSLLFFGLAAIWALGTARPRKAKQATGSRPPKGYREANTQWLRERTESEHWLADKAEADRLVAESRVNIIEAAKLENERKGRLLHMAMFFELIAVVFVAVSVLVILAHG